MKNTTIILAVLCSILTLSSCDLTHKEVNGNGTIVTKDIDGLSGFSKIDISSSFDIELIQSDEYKVTIITDENIIEHIAIEQTDDELTVSSKKGFSIMPSDKMKLLIAAPQ